MFSNIDLNTIIYFAAIIVAVIIVFGILSYTNGEGCAGSSDVKMS